MKRPVPTLFAITLASVVAALAALGLFAVASEPVVAVFPATATGQRPGAPDVEDLLPCVERKPRFVC